MPPTFRGHALDTGAKWQCGSIKVAKTAPTVKNRKTGQVSKTRCICECLEAECCHQFTVTTGTIFHDFHLPLSKWFLTVALMCDGKKSISAFQLRRSLGIGSYRTAWYLAHRIGKAMAGGGSSPFTGHVEADETLIGGSMTSAGSGSPGTSRPSSSKPTNSTPSTQDEPNEPI